MAPRVATYSIAACDLDARQWGVAVQSKFLAAASVVSFAEPEAGAVATQAYANPRYGPGGLALLREGASAEEAVRRLTEADDGRDHRQLGIVDREGRSATFTGRECLDWAGGRTGPAYAAQGNILVSGATVDALVETFGGSAGRPLAERLLDCLAAAQEAGGDRRGGGYAAPSDVVGDLRVDDHPTPIDELRRIDGIHQLLFGQTPKDDWLKIDDALGREVRERLAVLGYEGELSDTLFRWAATENLEERVEGSEFIDPVVLDELRRLSA